MVYLENAVPLAEWPVMSSPHRMQVGGCLRLAPRSDSVTVQHKVTHWACCVVQGPMKLMAEGYACHGEVFTVPVLHKNITFLLGPRVSAHFFKANDEEMSQKEVRRLLTALLRVSTRAWWARNDAGWLTRWLRGCRCTSSTSPPLARASYLTWTTRWGAPASAPAPCMQPL